MWLLGLQLGSLPAYRVPFCSETIKKRCPLDCPRCWTRFKTLTKSWTYLLHFLFLLNKRNWVWRQWFVSSGFFPDRPYAAPVIPTRGAAWVAPSFTRITSIWRGHWAWSMWFHGGSKPGSGKRCPESRVILLRKAFAYFPNFSLGSGGSELHPVLICVSFCVYLWEAWQILARWWEALDKIEQANKEWKNWTQKKNSYGMLRRPPRVDLHRSRV